MNGNFVPPPRARRLPRQQRTERHRRAPAGRLDPADLPGGRGRAQEHAGGWRQCRPRGRRFHAIEPGCAGQQRARNGLHACRRAGHEPEIDQHLRGTVWDRHLGARSAHLLDRVGTIQSRHDRPEGSDRHRLERPPRLHAFQSGQRAYVQSLVHAHRLRGLQRGHACADGGRADLRRPERPVQPCQTLSPATRS